MKIIVAGFAKTGTKSLAAALRLLGYDVYDLLEHAWYHENEWKKMLYYGGNVEDFQRMYQKVDVVMDAPIYFFWEEIHRAFPDAKIILTIRDEDSWFESFSTQVKQDNSDTWLKIMKTFSPTGFRYHRFFASFERVIHGYETNVWWPWKKSVPNEMVMKRNFRQHNDYVASNAPKNQLLIFRIDDGWEPLCKFLGKELPKVRFPHKNKNGTFHKEAIADKHLLMKRMQLETNFFLFFVLALGLAIAVCSKPGMLMVKILLHEF